ncbi:KAP family P-loop domain-containing protein, partial [Azotobacter beijerinckii]
GNKGTILATTNGGKTWAPQFSGTNADLASVTFLPDSRHGWVVGTSGTILATGDDNTRWESIAPYRRYWAPWYFALLLVGGSALAGLIAFVHPVSANAPSSDGPSGTATTLACDQPVLDKAADLLGYRAVVEALSSFIRNRATEPRVTIAVTGEWGSGKSSIMRMLQTDLDRAGFRTVWFNAWHHQQEGRPLAALFNSIRQQAVSLGALHTRSRLIWGRGGLYRVVACVAAIGLAVLAGDLLGEGLENAGQRVQQNIKYHVLHERSSYLGLASLAKLAPPAADIQADNSPADQTGTAGDQAARSGSQDLGRIRKDCAPEGALTKAKGGPLPGQVFCDLALNLVPDSEWLGSVQPSTCNARADADGKPCVFASLAGLLRTIEDSKGLDRPLTNPQRKLIGEAVQTQPPEPMFRWLQSSLLSGAAGVMLLLFTKGISVYGLQLLGPLQDVLGRLANKSNGKEAPGTVEHYRHEFRLLCQALDGRLVVFIDDLDRCTPDTVNGMLELTNYLVDVGSCFVVLGAAMERVKKCIHSPVETDDQERYACEYLRKLVHVELPVPLRRDELGRLINPHADRQRRSTRRTLWRQIRSCLKALMVIAFLVGFVHAGMALHNRIDGQAQVVDRVIAPTGEGRPPVQPDPGKDPGTEPTMADSKDVGLDAPINTEGSWPWLALSGLTLLLGSALVWRILWHYRDALKVALGGSIRETDSPNFLEALRLWSPLIAQHDPTPRQLKRFYNRARLLAAYERESSTSKPKAETMGESQPASPFKRLLHILKRLLTGFSGELPASASQSEAMDEAQLVALSALHHVYPPALEILANTATDLAETWDSIAKVLPNQSLAPAFSQARKDHQQKFSSLPCADEARRFAQLVAGIEVR